MSLRFFVHRMHLVLHYHSPKLTSLISLALYIVSVELGDTWHAPNYYFPLEPNCCHWHFTFWHQFNHLHQVLSLQYIVSLHFHSLDYKWYLCVFGNSSPHISRLFWRFASQELPVNTGMLWVSKELQRICTNLNRRVPPKYLSNFISFWQSLSSSLSPILFCLWGF